MSDINQTLVDRGSRYGSFNNHSRIAQLLKRGMQFHLPEKYAAMEADQREALEMIQHKIARIINGDPNYIDSWHDIAGYATLVEKRLNGESV